MTQVSQASGKTIYLLNPRGFCAGVVRAIDAVERAITTYGAPIYVRRQIVHNTNVVTRLEALGAIFIQEVDEAPEEATVILSAHGVAPTIRTAAQNRRLHIIDTICPLVLKIHQEVRLYYQTGRHIILIGHSGHPEIVGTMGQVPTGAITLVSDIADIDTISLPPNSLVAYAVQTTFSVKEAAAIVSGVQARFPDIVGPKSSDICYATTNRQEAVESVAHLTDHLIVVGDTISSNSKRLIEVAKSSGIRHVQLVRDGSEVDFALFKDAQNIAITAAASCPQECVDDVVRCLMHKWGGNVVEFGENQEHTIFKPVNIARRDNTAFNSSTLPEKLGLVSHDVDHLLTGIIPQMTGGEGRLTDAMRYAVIGGGKRLRAMLTVAVGELFGVSRKQSIRAAAALECIHAQSLILDDLPVMDNDDMRRGKPTVHRQFDQATAILAGDALLALAFEILADEKTHQDSAIRARLVSYIAKSIGFRGLAGGQMMDLFPSDNPTIDEVMECQKRKTGKLIEASVYAGAILGQADSSQTSMLMRYAENLGLAFQIRDDILDAIGDEAKVGKKLSKDAELGRINTVRVMGLEKAQTEAKRLGDDCIDIATRLNAHQTSLKEIAEFATSRLS